MPPVPTSLSSAGQTEFAARVGNICAVRNAALTIEKPQGSVTVAALNRSRDARLAANRHEPEHASAARAAQRCGTQPP
jgi:hypothetical protein